MPFLFSKHYTLQEARDLLPSVREWLAQLEGLRARLQPMDERLAKLMESGHDQGGPLVNAVVRTIGECRVVLREFNSRQIQVKDLDRGLVDFPSLREGKEVFLCWEKDEDDIGFWHDIESGFAGRERL